MASRYRTLPYDEALARRVLDRIAEGAMLRDLWRDPTLPTRGDLRRWRHADPAFEKRIRAAVNAARGRRMTTYDEDVADDICHRLLDGESLRSVCCDPAMPSVTTVFQWLKKQPGFVTAYEIAREMQAEILMGRAWNLLQDAAPDTVDAAAGNLAGLRWHAGRVSPKRYG